MSDVVSCVVQAAFGHDASDVLTDADWVTLPNVYEVEVNRPASRNLGVLVRYPASTCRVVLDNTDRRYDPANVAGPYVASGETLLQPMTPIRVLGLAPVETDGLFVDAGGDGGTFDVEYPLFRGYADRWHVTYGTAAKTSVCTLTATDGTKVLANYNGPEQSSQGGGEASGARVARILDNASWPSALRDIETGDATLQATTLARPAWEELLLVADSERGDVFFNGSGELVFLEQTHRGDDTRSTEPQATWGDGLGELKFANPAVSVDDTLIVNQVVLSNVGGSAQTAQDTTSQSRYLVRSLNRTDFLLETDGAALSYANNLLAQLKDPQLRFDGFDYSPGSPAEQVRTAEAALGVQVADRWRVMFTPPGGGNRIIRDVWVVGMRWWFQQARWGASFTFQHVDPTIDSGFRLDDPNSVLDTDALAY